MLQAGSSNKVGPATNNKNRVVDFNEEAPVHKPPRKRSLDMNPKDKNKALSSEQSIRTLFTEEERVEVANRLHDMKKGKKGLVVQNGRWDLLMVGCLLFTAIVTPYEACYMESNGFDFLFWLNRVVDCCFILDMFVTLNTVFEGADGKLVYDRKAIAKRYMRGWMAIDIVSVLPVPFDIVAAAAANDGVSVDPDAVKVKMLRFSRLLRIVKLARVVRAMRIIARWETESGLSYSLMAVLKNFAVVVVLMHWGACLWYFAATLVDDPATSTWTKDIAEGENKAADEVDASWFYLRALFNSVSILYGGTTADGFSPRNDIEYVFAITLQSIGAACYAYALGGVCDYISNRDLATQEYHQKVDNMNSFLRSENIPSKLKYRARDFFRHAKSVIRSRYYTSTLKMMSPHLKGDIVAQMHHGWFNSVRFLQHSPDSERATFVTEMALALKMEMYAAMDRIVRPGELCEQMYIVYWGMCGLLGRVLSSGKMIGEDLILNMHHPGCRRSYTCTALTFVQLYVLRSDALRTILSGEDLVETRQLVRKAALRMCFCRTVVMVAQSQEKTKQFFNYKRGVEITLATSTDIDGASKAVQQMVGPSASFVTASGDPVSRTVSSPAHFVASIKEMSSPTSSVQQQQSTFSKLTKSQLMWLQQSAVNELAGRCSK